MERKLNAAVLLLLFNRPECTKCVFNAVASAKPTRLYIAIDGPRKGNKNDEEGTVLVRNFVLNNINWPCEVKTLIRETNLGCKDAVSSAITWFFENEEEGIILEDDCLPNMSFFRFCDTLLEKYRHDERVRHISGVNFLDAEIKGDATYYFSKFTHVWGWASWRRVWIDYDKELTQLEKFLAQDGLGNIYPDKKIINVLTKEFNRVKKGHLNTWDFQYLLLNFINNGLCIIPRKSLITNIGFGEGSTHDHTHKIKPNDTVEIDNIIHPDFLIPQIQLDMQSLRKMKNLSWKSKVNAKLSMFFPQK